MRWTRSIMLAAALMLPLTACQAEGEDAGEAEIEVEAPESPDVIVEEEQPDVVVEEEDDDGFDADINVDEEGNVTGGVRVEDRDP